MSSTFILGWQTDDKPLFGGQFLKSQILANPYFMGYLPQQFLYFFPLPHDYALLVYIVHKVLSLLLLFQRKSGLGTFGIYSIYVTIVTMFISFFGNKMETLFSFVY